MAGQLEFLLGRMMRTLSLLLLVIVSFSAGAELYQQTSELQPIAEYGRVVASSKSDDGPKVTAREFDSGPTARWIWGPDDNRPYTLEYQFEADDVVASLLKASCDNVATIYLNGKRIASSGNWQTPMKLDLTSHLRDGSNTLTAKVANEGGVAGFVLKLTMRDSTGKLTHVVSGEEWNVAGGEDEIVVKTSYGEGVWGTVFDGDSFSGRVPGGTFEVQPGFVVEKLFTVPREELGSWVCITLDNKGRLLASDQGNKGISRITLPPLAKEGEQVETIVEKLDFSKCEVQPTSAQGMLYAFDSLYFSINGGPGSGLYRARDTDDDDQFDECVKLRTFEGGGEHGPHSLRLSPNGKQIYVIAGNHTKPPFQPGDERGNPRYRSPLATNWDEDLLLPRMWDANGHARGVLAPGGWIARY